MRTHIQVFVWVGRPGQCQAFCLSSCPPGFLETACLRDLGFSSSAKLVGQAAPGIPLSLLPQIDNASAFKKMSPWGSNLGPHACVESSLSYLPSPGSILLCNCMPSKGQPVVIDLLYWPVVKLLTLDTISVFVWGAKIRA